MASTTDRAILTKIGLENLSEHVLRDLIKVLDVAEKDIARQVREGLADYGGQWTTETGRRLQKLYAQIKAINVEAHGELLARLRPTLKGIAEDTVTQQALGAKDAWNVPSAATLNALIESKPYNGHILKDWIGGLEQGSFKRLQQAVNNGVIEGESVDQIVRRIVGSKALRYADGVGAVNRRMTAAAVRAAISHVNSSAAEAFALANPKLFKGVRWLSTLDTRTCPQCAALGGEIFPVSEGPRPPLHFNCRCTIEVLPLGSPMDEHSTYEPWFRQQTVAVQKEILGPSRYKLWRYGDLPLDRFVIGSRLIPLDQLAKIYPSAVQAMARNLPGGVGAAAASPLIEAIQNQQTIHRVPALGEDAVRDLGKALRTGQMQGDDIRPVTRWVNKYQGYDKAMPVPARPQDYFAEPGAISDAYLRVRYSESMHGAIAEPSVSSAPLYYAKDPVRGGGEMQLFATIKAPSDFEQTALPGSMLSGKWAEYARKTNERILALQEEARVASAAGKAAEAVRLNTAADDLRAGLTALDTADRETKAAAMGYDAIVNGKDFTILNPGAFRKLDTETPFPVWHYTENPYAQEAIRQSGVIDPAKSIPTMETIKTDDPSMDYKPFIRVRGAAFDLEKPTAGFNQYYGTLSLKKPLYFDPRPAYVGGPQFPAGLTNQKAISEWLKVTQEQTYVGPNDPTPHYNDLVKANDDLVKIAKRYGYDGIVYTHGDELISVEAFDPVPVTPVGPDAGTWSPNSSAAHFRWWTQSFTRRNRDTIGGIKNYSSDGYRVMNNALRGKPSNFVNDKFKQEMQEIIDSAVPLPEDTEVWRSFGRREKFVGTEGTGAWSKLPVMKEDGFMSWTTRQEIAEQSFGKGNEVFHAVLPKGTLVTPGFFDEMELILPPGTEYKVLKATNRVVDVEIIPRTAADLPKVADLPLAERSTREKVIEAMTAKEMAAQVDDAVDVLNKAAYLDPDNQELDQFTTWPSHTQVEFVKKEVLGLSPADEDENFSLGGVEGALDAWGSKYKTVEEVKLAYAKSVAAEQAGMPVADVDKWLKVNPGKTPMDYLDWMNKHDKVDIPAKSALPDKVAGQVAKAANAKFTVKDAKLAIFGTGD